MKKTFRIIYEAFPVGNISFYVIARMVEKIDNSNILIDNDVQITLNGHILYMNEVKNEGM